MTDRSNPSSSSYETSGGDDVPLSRRQRLLGFAKATRETYIPKITTSVTRLATDASRAFTNGAELYDDQGHLILPKDTTIELFPSYTREIDGKYFVDVKGWVSCPGLMTRKNRLILSLARQITKYNTNGSNSNQALSQLGSDALHQDTLLNTDNASDSDSIISDQSKIEEGLNPISSANSAYPNAEDTIKERLACFIARSIPNAEIDIVVGSQFKMDHNKIKVESVITDSYGNFETCIEVDYRPSVVQVKATTDESIFTFQDIMITSGTGIALISDIDDTIKLTGVIGDKRELMTNLLLNDVLKWKIAPVVNWYDDLYTTDHISFHYVSNSPWQLFSTIEQYFKVVNLPVGSVHLKQYSGNILSSLMEPSTERKKKSLTKIVEDFPNKKFICVGDSGEYDLEAYVELAKLNPGVVISINIRYVKDSLSELDDLKILSELRRLLASNKKSLNVVTSQEKEISPPPPPKVEVNLIDLESSSSDDEGPSPVYYARKTKLPPIVPKKPKGLQGIQLEKSPALPSRDYLNRAQTDSVINPIEHNKPEDDELPLPLPPRRSTDQPPQPFVHAATDTLDHDINIIDNLQNIYDSPYFFQLEEMDRKGANWIRKIITAIKDLEGTGTELTIFTDEETDFFDTKRILEEIKKLKL
ncbi:hypothetical protein DFJ63DRAFT_322821 [Scheffersomyces coipomensis]|uniref:uncharacterized protein n=1 Tax=Scheffersomyces coipomensis TaxID=1788519 RepID=UPI00315DEE0E